MTAEESLHQRYIMWEAQQLLLLGSCAACVAYYLGIVEQFFEFDVGA